MKSEKIKLMGQTDRLVEGKEESAKERKKGGRGGRVSINKFSAGQRCLFYCERVLRSIARSSTGKLSTSPECSLFPLIFTNISEHIEHLSPLSTLVLCSTTQPLCCLELQ